MFNFFENKSLVLIVVTVILILLIGISSAFSETMGQIGNILSVPITPVQKFCTFTGKNIEAFVLFFKDTKAIKEENEALKESIKKLQSENRELTKLKEKNMELKKALRLKGRFDAYDLVGANITAMDPGNWFNIFTLDVGSRDGIKADSPVITSSRGLVGRICSVHFSQSKVLSILDEDSVVWGWSEKGWSLRIRGDLEYKDRGFCIADMIPIEMDIAEGDLIETSGYGGIYPKGISIGKVIEVKNQDSDLYRFAVIEPSVDLENLEEVFILRKKSIEAGSEEK